MRMFVEPTTQQNRERSADEPTGAPRTGWPSLTDAITWSVDDLHPVLQKDAQKNSRGREWATCLVRDQNASSLLAFLPRKSRYQETGQEVVGIHHEGVITVSY